ncbi:MAG TPA: PAS domain S-box protein [Verrucomicrobiae bacterium]
MSRISHHLSGWLPRSLWLQFRIILIMLAALPAIGGLVALHFLRQSAEITRQLAEGQLTQMENSRELARTALLIEPETRRMLSETSPERMDQSYNVIETRLDALDRLARSVGETSDDVTILSLYQAQQNFRNLIHTVAGLRRAELRNAASHTTPEVFRRFQDELEHQATQMVTASDALAERSSGNYRAAVRRLAAATESDQRRVFLLFAGCLAAAWVLSRVFLERHVLSRLRQVCTHLTHGAPGNESVRIAVQGADEIGEMARAVEQFLGNRRELDLANRALHRSNDLLRAIFEAAPMATFGLDLNGNVCAVWNKAAERLLGWRETEVMGRRYPSAPADLEDAFSKIRERAGSGETLNGLESFWRRRDGTTIDCSIFAAPLHDPDARISASIVVLVDTTEHKRMENQILERTRELAASELLFRTIYNMAPVSIWQEDWTEVIAMIRSLQAKGVTDFAAWFHENPAFVANALNAVKIVDVNQWTLDMFKAKDKPDMLASLGTVFATPDTLPGFVGELVALAQGKMIYRTEMALNTVQGDQIQSLLAMSFPPPEDNSGNVLVSVIDITERKKAEENIQKLNAELQQRAAELEVSNKELESFSYSVSHDLRAPLRAVDGFSRMLLEDYTDKLDENGLDNLHRICAASQRMGNLIDGLLTVSRVARAGMRHCSVPLSDVAMQVAEDLQRTEPSRKVEVKIQPEMVAEGDPALLRAVLENLLGNAWKFTTKQPAARIEFGATVRKGCPAFFVRDNGAGFDMAYASKLFGVFQRLHATIDFPGTGIGLATVQRIIHRHGGWVEAEGAVGQGATFFFSLPRNEETGNRCTINGALKPVAEN